MMCHKYQQHCIDKMNERNETIDELFTFTNKDILKNRDILLKLKNKI